MAFGDNGKRKKTMFEKVTLFVVCTITGNTPCSSTKGLARSIACISSFA